MKVNTSAPFLSAQSARDKLKSSAHTRDATTLELSLREPQNTLSSIATEFLLLMEILEISVKMKEMPFYKRTSSPWPRKD